MNKGDLKNQIHQYLTKDLGVDVTNTQTSHIVEQFFELIVEGAKNSTSGASFIKFGTFKVVNRAQRKGRNPKSGEEITIPASSTLKFTPSKEVKEKLNK